MHPRTRIDYQLALQRLIDAGKSSLGLVRAFRETLAKIEDQPSFFGFIERPYHQAVVGKFPYSLIYEELADGSVFVIAMQHFSQDDIWRDRVSPPEADDT